MVDGIDINQDDAEKALLPDDLNSLAVGSYIVPNPNKRKYYPLYVLSIVAFTYLASIFLTFINFNISLILSLIFFYFKVNLNKKKLF